MQLTWHFQDMSLPTTTTILSSTPYIVLNRVSNVPTIQQLAFFIQHVVTLEEKKITVCLLQHTKP